MSWYPQVVLYMGIFDAGVIMLLGLVATVVILLGWDARKLWERVFPAVSMLIGSNIAAALILGATRWLLASVALVVVVLALADPAFAQSTTVDGGSLFGVLRPYVVELVGVAVAAVIGILAELARRRFGLDIEARHRASLQAAITGAAGLALNQLGNSIQGKTIDVKHAAIADAVNYVLKSAPDALAKFGLGPQEIAEKIVAKIPQIANTSAPPAA